MPPSLEALIIIGGIVSVCSPSPPCLGSVSLGKGKDKYHTRSLAQAQDDYK